MIATGQANTVWVLLAEPLREKPASKGQACTLAQLEECSAPVDLGLCIIWLTFSKAVCALKPPEM